MIKPTVLRHHNQEVQKHLQTTVFNSGGCKSYYLDANGRNFAAWPWSLATLKKRLSSLNLQDYDLSYGAPAPSITPEKRKTKQKVVAA